ncbi:MAG: hypothetical protein WA139_02975 [Candidatus Aenigmatarchaeota archaeon]
MFEAEGSIGIFLWGAILGWVLIFFITRNKNDIKGAVLLIGAIGGTTVFTWLNGGIFDEYFLGLFAGFVANIIVRVIGKKIGGKAGEAVAEVTVYRNLRI